MKDLNFFSAYNGDNKQKRGFEIYFCITAGIVGALIILNAIIGGVKIFMVHRSISQYNLKLNETEFKEQLSEAENINKKIEVLSNYEGAVSEVISNVKKDDIVTDGLLNDISGNMPKEVTFKDFDINGYDVTIKGSTNTRSAIGEFEHNLCQLAEIKSVHVDKIAKSNTVGEDYTFEMTCILKEVK
jgi:type IV pilus assembly protein PilN